MKKQDYTTTITAKITAEHAFKGIAEVSKWWTENLDGKSSNLGDLFTVHFNESFVLFKVIEVDPGKKIVWLVIDCYLHWLKDKKEWKDTKISFELSAMNDETTIVFTHLGLTEAVECYNDCVKGWDQYIKGSLFTFLTDGKVAPQIKKNVI